MNLNCQFFCTNADRTQPGDCIVGSLPARDSRLRAICQVRQLILYSRRACKASPTNFSQPMLKLCDRN
ncbi:hypothetical protein D0A34_15235 [Microcoleus vaginatus PCC 9802]|nr:hypothetical protein D0A34_15235 [Microcoleus vaginatus PCC 9802]